MAPEPRIGFEMSLLRMLAFRPEPAALQSYVAATSAAAAAVLPRAVAGVAKDRPPHPPAKSAASSAPAVPVKLQPSPSPSPRAEPLAIDAGLVGGGGRSGKFERHAAAVRAQLHTELGYENDVLRLQLDETNGGSTKSSDRGQTGALYLGVPSGRKSASCSTLPTARS